MESVSAKLHQTYRRLESVVDAFAAGQAGGASEWETSSMATCTSCKRCQANQINSCINWRAAESQAGPIPCPG